MLMWIWSRHSQLPTSKTNGSYEVWCALSSSKKTNYSSTVWIWPHHSSLHATHPLKLSLLPMHVPPLPLSINTPLSISQKVIQKSTTSLHVHLAVVQEPTFSTPMPGSKTALRCSHVRTCDPRLLHRLLLPKGLKVHAPQPDVVLGTFNLHSYIEFPSVVAPTNALVSLPHSPKGS